MTYTIFRLPRMVAGATLSLSLAACVGGDPGAQMGAALLGGALSGAGGNAAISAGLQTAAGAGALQNSYTSRFNGMDCATIKAEVGAAQGGMINPLAASGQAAYVQAGRDVMRAKGC